MIVAETATTYRFVTQPAHARLAGQFAEHWGNRTFERPEPFPAVVAATVTHDDGWQAYDRRPHLDDDGAPVNFTELPPATWIDLYDRGIEAVIELDPYAGLLVSMHGTGLRRRRYSLSPTWPDTPAEFAPFVNRQESRQRDLIEQLRDASAGPVTAVDHELLQTLHETGTPPTVTTSRLWTNYVLLQSWDSLSLALCRSVSPPASSAVAPVPRQPGDSGVELSLGCPGAATVSVAPYPFDTSPLRVQFPARTVEKSAFDSEDELVSAYYATGRSHHEISLVPD